MGVFPHIQHPKYGNMVGLSYYCQTFNECQIFDGPDNVYILKFDDNYVKRFTIKDLYHKTPYLGKKEICYLSSNIEEAYIFESLDSVLWFIDWVDRGRPHGSVILD